MEKRLKVLKSENALELEKQVMKKKRIQLRKMLTTYHKIE